MCESKPRDQVAWNVDPLNILNPNEGAHYDKSEWYKNYLGDPGGIFAPGGLLGPEDKGDESTTQKKEKKTKMPTFQTPDLSGFQTPPEAGDADKAVLRNFRKRFGRRQTILTGGSGAKGPVRRRRLFSETPSPSGSLLGG